MSCNQRTDDTEPPDERYSQILCELLRYVVAAQPPDWLMAWAKSIYTMHPPNVQTRLPPLLSCRLAGYSRAGRNPLDNADRSAH